MSKNMNFTEIIGPHPISPNPFGRHFDVADGYSAHGVPYRELKDKPRQRSIFNTIMKEWIVKHHISPEVIARDRRRREALSRQGFTDVRRRFPINLNTQKGNWGEIFLAEYLTSACSAKLPVYRLRYNTNVDQSMKGDDVLVFDLDSNPIRVLVGEAKFRSTPSKQVVEEIVEALAKSNRAGLPVSLQFVVDRLFSEGQAALGARVDECSLLFARGHLQLDYVGLLVSNPNAAVQVRQNAKSTIKRLAVMSLCLLDPEGAISTCYKVIEDQP